MPKFALLLTIAIASLAAASTAAAKAPIKTHGELHGYGTLTGVCDFPIGVESFDSRDRIRFYDEFGTPTMFIVHITVTDIFTANGKTLTGEPYNYTFHVVFENGAPTEVYSDGRVEKAILPDGTLILSAGRTNWLEHPFDDFLIAPDFGATGDIDAFCAYFSS